MGVSAERRCLRQGVQESAQLREVIAHESFVRNAGLTDRLAEVETLLRCAPSRGLQPRDAALALADSLRGRVGSPDCQPDDIHG